ncbi:MAG TPA: SRPBCC domain-containing protein [Chitinophagales bacterium]|nr:SRPBCC domain-containing protein [Chitinophagales bacterium]
MAKTIYQKLVFKNTTPAQLYEMYVDSKKQTASTGMAAKISAKEGAKYTTCDGYNSGKNLVLKKNELIVQTWFAQNWEKTYPDSILILAFSAKGKDAVLEMTHANIPDKHAKGMDKAWHTYYWEPWKKYLKNLK